MAKRKAASRLVKESKNLIRKGEKFVRGLGHENQELIGFVAGKLIGDKVNALYESRKPEEKLIWEISRPMHHYELGLVLKRDGQRGRDPLMKGVGYGLMISDIEDREKVPIRSRTKSKRAR